MPKFVVIDVCRQRPKVSPACQGRTLIAVKPLDVQSLTRRIKPPLGKPLPKPAEASGRLSLTSRGYCKAPNLSFLPIVSF